MAVIKPVEIKKRGKSYQLYYYNPQGERRRITVGHDYQMAQRMAVKFTDCLMEGKDPETEMKIAQINEEVKSKTLCDLYPIFFERHGKRQSKKMQESYYYCFKNICRCKALSEVPINSISRGLVIDYMNARIKQDGVMAATVNKEASFIRGLLSKALEWGMIDINPLYGFRMFRESEKRNVVITPEEALSLLEQLSTPIANIVEFAIYSGFRKENILGLRIENILFHDITETGEVELVTKGNRKEVFPLGKHATAVLKSVIGNRTEGYVFLNQETKTRYFSINKAFDIAVRKIDLKVGNSKLRFHDLRHVFATWLYQRGVSLDIVSDLLGHRNRNITERYTTFDRMKYIAVIDTLPNIRIKSSTSSKLTQSDTIAI